MKTQNATDVGENRGKQIFLGAAVLFTVATVIVGFLFGWRFVPGLVGESLGTVAGVLSTPFFMEASFALLGLVIVIGLNAWRRHKAGDEFVALEISEPGNQPESGGDGK